MITEPSRAQEEARQLAAHLFRHESGRLMAGLTRILGWDAVDTAEDIVQEALLAALQVWPYRGIPEQPAAWLRRVAFNRALDRQRRVKRAKESHASLLRELEARAQQQDMLAGHGDEDLLAMMFACAHPDLPEDAQVALMLRVLCGFTTREIAEAYLESEAAVSQRLVRAKKRLRQARVGLDLHTEEDFARESGAVLLALYLMFSEGYASSSGPRLLRDELCAEALRLNGTLCADPRTDSPAARALWALMHFQASRLATRTDAGGNLLLLSEQNRSLWDMNLITRGFTELEKAACGTEVTAYHLEAGIAACHASASSYEDTDWLAILSLYDQLVEMSPSPVVALNRAVAVSMVRGPRAALKEVERLAGDPRFARYHLYFATLADFNSRAGRVQEARVHYRQAISLAGTDPERRFLERRLSDVSE